jgi:hypothetical protein
MEVSFLRQWVAMQLASLFLGVGLRSLVALDMGLKKVRIFLLRNVELI